MTNAYIYFGSALLALMAMPLAIALAGRLHVFDHPCPRSIHSTSVPRTGGIAIVAAVMMILGSTFAMTSGPISDVDLSKLMWVLAGGLFVAAVGLIDDKRSLPVGVKLLAEVLAALGVWAAGVRIESVWFDMATPWTFGWASAPITVAWIILMVNALNLADGLDGLAAGIAAITCGTIGLLAILTGQPLVAALALAVAGAASGFLVFNFHPAKVFMGDCGSLFLGFIIGCGSVMCTMRSPNPVSLALPALAMGIPILDVALAVLRRVLGRRSIISPDRSHIHHMMLAMGLGQRQVAVLMYSASLAAVGIGTFMFVVCGYRCLAIFVCTMLLLGMVFRWAGALPLSKMLGALHRNLALARQSKSDRRNIEESLVSLSHATSLESWWEGVCLAADRMGFKSLCMKIAGPAGISRSLRWQASSYRLDEQGVISVDLIPHSQELRAYVRLTCNVPVHDLAELAGRRVALFGRLIDETSALAVLIPGFDSLSLQRYDGLRSEDVAAPPHVLSEPQTGDSATPHLRLPVAAGQVHSGA
ncbi:MAG: MraY family glycosyltransferase [Planctomycetota bacterium]|nr:MraY family glycosyltransferase [Planctomycetota bacterium]